MKKDFNLCIQVYKVRTPDKVIRDLIPFSTTHVCEKDFYTLVCIENKYKNRLQNIDSYMWFILSSIEHEISKLVVKMQHQPWHYLIN